MKKLLLLLMFVVPFAVMGASNLKLNGMSEVTVTSVPTNVVLTCDVDHPGNKIAVTIKADLDLPIFDEEAEEFAVASGWVTDGVGWIHDPENSDNDIMGDETPEDGKIKITLEIEQDIAMVLAKGSAIVTVTDQNQKEMTALVIFDIQPVAPYFMGIVTDALTGLPIHNALVGAIPPNLEEDDDEMGMGLTDESGQYVIQAYPGTWKVFVFDFFNGMYQPTDTVDVTVAEDQVITQSFQMDPYTCYVEGHLKMENGDPVPNINIIGGNLEDEDINIGNITRSSETGYYKMGLLPGDVTVTAASLINMENSNWPNGYYVDPSFAQVSLTDGDTKIVNFTFKEYTAFVEGTCTTTDGKPLAGVEVTALYGNLLGGDGGTSSSFSDENGEYRVGILAGMVLSLTAEKDGYTNTQPSYGHTMFNVGEGQTVSGKDFVFDSFSAPLVISGRVTYSDGTPAPNVYVTTVNEWETTLDNHLITYTDSNGNYSFDDLPTEGLWLVGVYKSGYGSTPGMHYWESYSGIPGEHIDFVLGWETSVENKSNLIPQEFSLNQNYPNPYNPAKSATTTRISFFLDKQAETEIAIYNINGQLVTTINQGDLPKGFHDVNWNGRDGFGKIVPSGIYLYKVTAGTQSLAKRMMVVH